MATATQAPGLGARIGEYFTLSAAQATQAKLGEPVRKEIEGALALGRQRAEGAEALWSNGHTAEALRLAVESLLETVKAAPAYGGALGIGLEAAASADEAGDASKPEPVDQDTDDAKPSEPAGAASDAGSDTNAEAASDVTSTDAADEPKAATAIDTADPGKSEPGKSEAGRSEAGKSEPAKAAVPPAPNKDPAKALLPDEPWSRALASRGVAAARVEKAKAALAAARAAKLPLLDADVSPASGELYEQVLDARHTIDKAFAMLALPKRDLGWTRFSRIGTTALVVSALALGFVLATRQPAGIFADASDTWNQSPTFAPELAIDGRDETYWLLPDGQTGWIEARISPPVHIEHVRLLNTHNPPHDDRATSDYTLEVYSGGDIAERVEGSFEFSRSPAPVTHDMSVDAVERIRFVVRGHHNVGGGLADLSWE